MPPQQNHELPAVAMPEETALPQAENAYAVPVAEKPAAMVAEHTQASPMPPMPALPQQPAPLPDTPPPAVPDPAALTPVMADDVDLIEKEWVTKAKEIVARTRDDPRQQNREMNRVKADYMKKRYDKDLKLDEA